MDQVLDPKSCCYSSGVALQRDSTVPVVDHAMGAQKHSSPQVGDPSNTLIHSFVSTSFHISILSIFQVCLLSLRWARLLSLPPRSSLLNRFLANRWASDPRPLVVLAARLLHRLPLRSWRTT